MPNHGATTRSNTSIATYIWVLTNRKPEHRKGKAQLIDATEWYQLLGKKNCELGKADIERICETFLAFKETEQSMIFPNAAFGYWRVIVEQPLQLVGAKPDHACTATELKELKKSNERSEDAPPIIKEIHKKGATAKPLCGLFAATINGKLDVREAAALLADGFIDDGNDATGNFADNTGETIT